MSPKQTAVHLLRRSGLLPIAEKARLGWKKLRNGRATFSIPIPPSDVAYDAYGELNWHNYLADGERMATYIAAHIQQGKVLDWGCGPARVTRHLPALLQQSEIYGCDANRKSIEWCSANITRARFFANDRMPPMTFGDDSFDSIYAISVFTHLSESAQRAWITELHRILKPGGLLLTTFHGDACTNRLLAHERKRYDSGELVVRDGVNEGTRCFLSYHPKPLVLNLLGDFSIQLHDPAPNDLSSVQDVWIARKPTFL